MSFECRFAFIEGHKATACRIGAMVGKELLWIFVGQFDECKSGSDSHDKFDKKVQRNKSETTRQKVAREGKKKEMISKNWSLS